MSSSANWLQACQQQQSIRGGQDHRFISTRLWYLLCHAPTPHLHTHTYLPWPELSPLHNVFKVVADDVGLLEEQSHGVGQVMVLSHLLPLKTRRRKQLRQTNTYQTSYIVAVLWSRERRGGGGGGGCCNGGGQIKR